VRIDSIETYLGDQIAIVRVRTDDGAEGFGQTSPFAPDISVHVLHRLAARHFLGRDPWDLEAMVAECLRQEYKFPGTFILRALCGIDTALWDLLGKVTNRPVYKLLGGEVRRAIPVYASSMSRSISPEDEADRLIDLRRTQGFRAAKIRIGDVMADDTDAAPGRTERIIKVVRERLGDDFDINADANSGFSVSRAIRVGRILEEHGYFHYEEPCPYPQIENTAKVAAALDIPVAGGEQDNSLPQFRRMIEMGAVDIVQPDVGYLGGLSRSRIVARMAEVAGIPCTPHCSNQSMLQLFVAHLVAAMPACSQYQEWGIENNDWTKDIYDPMLEVVDGNIVLSDRPGWGVQISDRVLTGWEKQVSNL
jgi:L-alanine-DL-glutamate epimerase-like enolase superfamily enzyme